MSVQRLRMLCAKEEHSSSSGQKKRLCLVKLVRFLRCWKVCYPKVGRAVLLVFIFKKVCSYPI